jgi:hypothetical protein
MIKYSRKPRSKKSRKPRSKKSRKPRSKKSRKPRSKKSRKPRSKKSRKPRSKKSRKPRSKKSRKSRSKKSRKPRSKKSRKPRSKKSRKPTYNRKKYRNHNDYSIIKKFKSIAESLNRSLNAGYDNVKKGILYSYDNVKKGILYGYDKVKKSFTNIFKYKIVPLIYKFDTDVQIKIYNLWINYIDNFLKKRDTENPIKENEIVKLADNFNVIILKRPKSKKKQKKTSSKILENKLFQEYVSDYNNNIINLNNNEIKIKLILLFEKLNKDNLFKSFLPEKQKEFKKKLNDKFNYLIDQKNTN